MYDLLGEITTEISVTQMTLHADMKETLGTSILFKFSGICNEVGLETVTLGSLSSTGALTIGKFNRNEY